MASRPMSDPGPTEYRIRVSSLSSYADCPRRSAANLFARDILAAGYTLRELPKSIGAPLGTGLHTAAAMALDEKLRTGTASPLDVVQNAAIETFRNESKVGYISDDVTPDLNTGERQLMRMAATYMHDLEPEIHPIFVEERLEAQVSPSIFLSGQPDTLAREPGAVRDLKGGKRMGNHRPQIGGYSMIARVNDIPALTKGVVDWIERAPLTKYKKPFAQPPAVSLDLPIEECETAAWNVVKHMEIDLNAFRFGDPDRHMKPADPWAFLANPMSMLCGEKWCSAWGTDFCREHKIKEAS